eukprot:4930582-Amphidinium_carterae.2
MERTVRNDVQVANTLNESEVQDIHKAVEVLKWYLKERAMELMREDVSGVVMIQYSCDGTPVRTRTHYAVSAGVKKARGLIVHSHKYPVQQAFVSNGSGSKMDHLVFREPQSLQHGKTMPALLACAAKLLQGPWVHGAPQSLTAYTQIHDKGVGRVVRHGVSGLIAERRESMETESTFGQLGQSQFAQLEDHLSSMHVGISAMRKSPAFPTGFLSEWLGIVPHLDAAG